MFRNKTFSFTGHFKIFAIISIILVITGIVGLIGLPFGLQLFNLDIDFLGGTTMQFELYTTVDRTVTDDIASIVESVSGVKPSSVTRAGDAGTQVIVKSTELSSEVRDEVFAAVAEAYNLPEGDQPIKSDYVSASVGADLRNAAITASIVAVLLILVYITIRFEFKSGIAAVVALVHDILVMLSMYIIFRIPFNMNFIAAALTILGYSINATIVVFDRIRENRKLDSKTEFAAIVDKSIWQTFARSINTTITTLFPIILLFIFGVTSVRNFALPIAIGLVSGCYSSICISGPVWNLLNGKKKAA
jgi:preprotein translocase SecF subunit